MFITAHDLELSVGGQVYLGEAWILATSLQLCSEDREMSLLGFIQLSMYKIMTIYLAHRPTCPLDPVSEHITSNPPSHTEKRSEPQHLQTNRKGR